MAYKANVNISGYSKMEDIIRVNVGPRMSNTGLMMETSAS